MKKLVVVMALGLWPLLCSAAEIHDAVKSGNVAEVQAQLKKWPPRLNSRAKENDLTPIQIAALRGDAKMVEFLLAQGPDPKYVAEALRYAVWRGDLPLVRLFIEKGAEVQSNLIDSAMNHTVINDESIIDPDKQTESIPPTPENLKPRLEIVRLLIEKRLSVDWVLPLTRETPLFFAPYWGVDMVKLLLDNNANPLSVDAEWRATPMHYAALTASDPGVFDLFLVKVPVNRLDRFGRTPLFWAARKGNLAAVQALIERGADVNLADQALWTPLHIAAARGHLEVVKFLLDHGAKIDARTVYGWSPLYVVAWFDRLPVAQLLLERGSDVNLGDIVGQTVLGVAQKRKNQSMEDLFRAKGGSLNARACREEECKFEEEVRFKRAHFFTTLPAKNSFLIEGETGLFVFEIRDDDFLFLVTDLERGDLKGKCRFTTVKNGRADPVSPESDKNTIIIIDGDHVGPVTIHALMVIALDDADPGHANRIGAFPPAGLLRRARRYFFFPAAWASSAMHMAWLRSSSRMASSRLIAPAFRSRASLVSRSPSGDLPAMFSASANARVSSPSAGTTSCTNPIRAASAASKKSPVSSHREAVPSPTARVNSHELPMSAPPVPMLM